MKKLVCLMMTVVMMLAVCAAGFAEESAEMSPFVQVTADAQVYQEAGGAATADTLAAGSLCALVETVTAEGSAWFHVLYLNSEKKAAEGYLREEDAKQLTAEELTALMNDEEKANEMLDLLDALSEFVQPEDTTGTTDTGDKKGMLDDFFDKAMAGLSEAFNIDLSAGLGEITGKGQEVINNMTEAGKDLLDSVTKSDAVKEAEKTGKELVDKAVTIGEGLLDTVKNSDALKDIEKAGKDLKDSAGEKMETAVKTVKEKINEWTEKGTDASKGAEKKITELVTKVTKIVDDFKVDPAKTTEELKKKLDGAKTLIDNISVGEDNQVVNFIKNGLGMLFGAGETK